MTPTRDERPSPAVFGPQSKRPKRKALRNLWLFLRQERAAQPVRDTISSLLHLSPVFESDSSVSELKPGLTALQCLSDWIANGNLDLISDITRGAVVFPLLLAFHVASYIQYLRRTGIAHGDLLDAIADAGGGIQGFCVGFLAAVTVAGSTDERDLVDRVCDAIKLSMAIGFYSDLEAYASGKQRMEVVRYKNASQAKTVTTYSPAVRWRSDDFNCYAIH